TFQKIFRRMAASLGIQVGLVMENTHKLTDTLHPAVVEMVALPINGALMQPAKTLWQSPSSIAPMAR
ncbi:hypothetical protein KIL84_012169, partial [Mauremys mutica]